MKKDRVYLIRLDSRGRLKELPRGLFLSMVRDRLIEVRKRTERAIYGAPLARYRVWVDASTGQVRFIAKNVPKGASGGLKSAFGLMRQMFLYKVEYKGRQPIYSLRDELDAQVWV